MKESRVPPIETKATCVPTRQIQSQSLSNCEIPIQSRSQIIRQNYIPTFSICVELNSTYKYTYYINFSRTLHHKSKRSYKIYTYCWLVSLSWITWNDVLQIQITWKRWSINRYTLLFPSYPGSFPDLKTNLVDTEALCNIGRFKTSLT